VLFSIPAISIPAVSIPVGYSVTNHASSFHCVVWQNCAIGTPGKAEMKDFYAHILKFQNH